MGGIVGGDCMGGGLDQGLRGWSCVMYVCVVSLDYLCRWQVQVSVSMLDSAKNCLEKLKKWFNNTMMNMLLLLSTHSHDPC